VLSITTNSAIPARFSANVIAHSRPTERLEACPGYDGGHRDQEVLGEQLRSADGEKDGTYPGGQ